MAFMLMPPEIAFLLVLGVILAKIQLQNAKELVLQGMHKVLYVYKNVMMESGAKITYARRLAQVLQKPQI
jgi:hypothetical protein